MYSCGSASSSEISEINSINSVNSINSINSIYNLNIDNFKQINSKTNVKLYKYNISPNIYCKPFINIKMN